jgi:hypothetical protein
MWKTANEPSKGERFVLQLFKKNRFEFFFAVASPPVNANTNWTFHSLKY